MYVNSVIDWSHWSTNTWSITPQEKDLSGQDTMVLQTLNSLMACGELPTLFSNDEMEGLLQVWHTLIAFWLLVVVIKFKLRPIQALAPAIKRDFPSEEADPLQYFTARIYRNFRIVLCLSPTSPLLNTLAQWVGGREGGREGGMEGGREEWREGGLCLSPTSPLLNTLAQWTGGREGGRKGGREASASRLLHLCSTHLHSEQDSPYIQTLVHSEPAYSAISPAMRDVVAIFLTYNVPCREYALYYVMKLV